MYWGFHLVSTHSSAKKQWQWQKCEDAGAVVESSDATFQSLNDCMRDARDHGYWGSAGLIAEQ
jgi:hypothetical protein